MVPYVFYDFTSCSSERVPLGFWMGLNWMCRTCYILWEFSWFFLLVNELECLSICTLDTGLSLNVDLMCYSYAQLICDFLVYNIQCFLHVRAHYLQTVILFTWRCSDLDDFYFYFFSCLIALTYTSSNRAVRINDCGAPCFVLFLEKLSILQCCVH